MLLLKVVERVNTVDAFQWNGQVKDAENFLRCRITTSLLDDKTLCWYGFDVKVGDFLVKNEQGTFFGITREKFKEKYSIEETNNVPNNFDETYENVSHPAPPDQTSVKSDDSKENALIKKLMPKEVIVTGIKWDGEKETAYAFFGREEKCERSYNDREQPLHGYWKYSERLSSGDGDIVIFQYGPGHDQDATVGDWIVRTIEDFFIVMTEEELKEKYCFGNEDSDIETTTYMDDHKDFANEIMEKLNNAFIDGRATGRFETLSFIRK